MKLGVNFVRIMHILIEMLRHCIESIRKMLKYILQSIIDYVFLSPEPVHTTLLQALLL